jgi:hypothetical protein
MNETETPTLLLGVPFASPEGGFDLGEGRLGIQQQARQVLLPQFQPGHALGLLALTS